MAFTLPNFIVRKCVSIADVQCQTHIGAWCKVRWSRVGINILISTKLS